METSIVVAWLVGEGFISYRIVSKDRRPPLPGEILGFSGLFAVLALLSEFQPGLATLIAWGVDVAAFMNVIGPQITNKTAASQKAPGTNAVAGK